ncbi:MAG: hypothetical protein UX02_C0009G0001 [Candidatus Moranbacteria bacterium GW2011_GWC1_45_18]|nr:MAG: hypothetical protein UX02_C0009G0001 [Candidatus Moranbacteria bacterium GW2011_GWC1_45_18]
MGVGACDSDSSNSIFDRGSLSFLLLGITKDIRLIKCIFQL